MGMETSTKIYLSFIFNLVYIKIRKTSLFWLNNLMTSLWKPSILILQKVLTFSQQVKGVTCFLLVCACFATSGSCVDCYEPQNSPTQGHLNCITKKYIHLCVNNDRYKLHDCKLQGEIYSCLSLPKVITWKQFNQQSKQF